LWLNIHNIAKTTAFYLTLLRTTVMEFNQKNHPFLSIVIPVFNEQENIAVLYKRVVDAVSPNAFEIIFINDGSSDFSLGLIKELANNDNRVKYISLSRNFGHQLAVYAGIEKSRGECLVIMDADLQDPPELIPELLLKLNSGFDIVYAKRRGRKGDSFFKKLTAKLFYRILRSITAVDIPIDTGDYRMISRRVRNIIIQMPEKNKFLRGQMAWMGFKQSFIEFEREPRLHGKSGYSFKKMLNFALDGITGFSHFPIRLVTYIGLIMSLVSVLAIIYALVSKFVLHSTVKGWTSMMILMTLIGGTQLFCMGIIGEYISRIMSNVMNRPDYLIEETNIETAAKTE